MIDDYIDRITTWAKGDNNIAALLVVGSQAREAATENSDIDLVVICKQPEQLLSDVVWINQFGSVDQYFIEQWGKVQSVRVFYQANSAPATEIEFGITSLDWLAEPLDAGTLTVIRDGAKILVDKIGTLTELINHSRV